MACRFLYTPAAALVALLLQAAAASATFPADGGLLSRPAAAALSFEEGYTQLFGDSNLRLHGDGKRVHISLDERTGIPEFAAASEEQDGRLIHSYPHCVAHFVFVSCRCRVRVAGRVPPWLLQRPHQAALRLRRRRRRRLLRKSFFFNSHHRLR